MKHHLAMFNYCCHNCFCSFVSVQPFIFHSQTFRDQWL